MEITVELDETGREEGAGLALTAEVAAGAMVPRDGVATQSTFKPLEKPVRPSGPRASAVPAGTVPTKAL